MAALDGVIRITRSDVLEQFMKCMEAGYDFRIIPHQFGEGRHALAVFRDDHPVVMVPRATGKLGSIDEQAADIDDLPDDTQAVINLLNALALEIMPLDKSKLN